jgi:hypothetical protein
LGSDDEFFQRTDAPAIQQDQQEGPRLGPIEALELYSSEHPESVEQLQNWYWKKFETMFEAFMKRKAVDEARELKHAMISGLWSNSNYDDNKDTRKKALQDIENNYQEAINIIYNNENETEIQFDQGLFSGIPEEFRD